MVATTPLDEGLLLRLREMLPREQPRSRPVPQFRPLAGTEAPAWFGRGGAPAATAVPAADPVAADEPVALLEQLVERLSRHSRAFGCVDWLDDSAQELQQARELASMLAAREVQLLAGLERLAGACASDPEGSEALGTRMAETAARLPAHTARIERALDEFHRFEAGLIRDDMRARRAECELEARRFRELAELADSLRAQLSRRRFPARLFGRGLSAERRRAMAQRLRELSRRSRSRYRFIEEPELLRWLDGIVEAGLHLSEEAWLEELQEARLLLLQLLNVYCLQDRLPATELAAQVLLRADAHERLEYCPDCEDYLARYLGRRRREMFGGGGGLAVDRLARFQRVRELLTEEYLSRACGG
ncbi:MAG: hypothetical protein R3225_00345 [Halofilum sp. (in: g-proteobacteria)]|nr:hypothetical protein [Halofilum sp. (in: g-proteobacteria)]